MSDRLEILVARRALLNRLGDYTGYFFNPYDEENLPLDTAPHRNSSEWNRRRIAARNKINAEIKGIQS
jgi:hypothetical protein